MTSAATALVEKQVAGIDLRLAIPAAGAWVSAGILIGVPWLALAVAVVAWALAAASWRRLPAVTLSLVAVALLSSLIAVHAPARLPAHLVEAADSGRRISAEFVVTESPRGDRAVGSLDGVPAVLFATLDDNVRIGSTLSVRGTIRAAEPGDAAAFLMRGDAAIVAEPPWYLNWANDLRTSFVEAMSGLPGDGADLLPGLAIGDTSAVSTELDAAMKASSLSHLTAVSGANCAIVVGMILALGRAFRMSRSARITLAAAVLLGFVILVTPEPSVLRAAAMALIVLGAMASGRPVRGVPVLALAVIVLLCFDPWLAREYGFILSVLATAGLLVVARPLAELLSRWLPPKLALVLSVPAAAQLLCQPVLVLLQPVIPTWGVAANVLAEPAAPVATVLGLLACLALPVIPWLGHVLAAVAWLPATWIAAVANVSASAPGAALPWPEGALGCALLALPTALVVAALLGQWRWPLVIAALVISGLVGTLLGARLATGLDRPQDWSIAMCDVGQGDATLVRSAGAVALIDTGPDPVALRSCLDDLGIGHIDLLVLSHFDLDHVGGTDAVFGEVGTVLIGPSSGADDDGLATELLEHGARVLHADRGDRGTLGDLRWSILWPRARTSDSGNPASVAIGFECPLELRGGCLSSVFLGDLGQESQSRLLAAGSLDPVDVVKVAHHGSADQEPRFYAQLGATVGIIGVGAGNSYGHPTELVLEALAASGTTALRTDRNGLILLSPRESGVDVWTAR